MSDGHPLFNKIISQIKKKISSIVLLTQEEEPEVMINYNL